MSRVVELCRSRGEVCSRAVQLCLHQHQLVVYFLLLHGSVQPPPAQVQLQRGERVQEGERPIRIVLDREIDQDIEWGRSWKLSLLLRVPHFRPFARWHHLPPFLLPCLNPLRHLESSSLHLPTVGRTTERRTRRLLPLFLSLDRKCGSDRDTSFLSLYLLPPYLFLYVNGIQSVASDS